MSTNPNFFAGLIAPSSEKNVVGMLLEKHLTLATRAHNWTSHVPEKRGKQIIFEHSNQLEADLKAVAELGGDVATYQEKYERLFCAWLHAKSNCISSMITGPSKFPTRRAEKANNSEMKRYNELTEWRERCFKAIEKAHRKATTEQLSPLDEIRKKVADERRALETMKAANKITQSKKTTKEAKIAALVELGFSAKRAPELLEPDYVGRVGFPSFSLTNCRNRLKNNEARLAELERRAATEAKEVERPDGITIVENAADNRLQVFFPGKPDDETRAKLKANGFRWAPSNGCWQSYLNPTAIQKLKTILQ